MLSLNHSQGRIHQIEYAMEAVKQVKTGVSTAFSSDSLIPSPWEEESGNETTAFIGVEHIVEHIVQPKVALKNSLC